MFPCKFNDARCKDSLFGCQCGKGDPDPPRYQEDPATKALKQKIGGQVSGLLDTPYEDYVSRFTPSQETSDILGETLTGYRDLMGSEDYGLGDYEEVEKKYLDTILGAYREDRAKGKEELQEQLIAENLFGSGPGFGLQEEFVEGTAKGSADIANIVAKEAIDRRFKEQSYKDALQRGDYTTMYNLALSKGAYDVAPAEKATQAQLSAISPALGLFGEMQSGDLAKYQADLSSYQALMNKEKSSFGGLGAGLGSLGGLLYAASLASEAAPLTLAGAAPWLAGGALVGGGVGSMFEY